MSQSDQSAVATLPGEPESAGAARRFVRCALDGHPNGELVEVAVLLTSEVVTNAIVHVDSAVVVSLRCSAEALEVAVSDGCPTLPVLWPVPGLLEGGRGLLLVNEMADAWGAVPTAEGKTVWFRLSTSSADRPR